MFFPLSKLNKFEFVINHHGFLVSEGKGVAAVPH